jgi:hypothetical protein
MLEMDLDEALDLINSAIEEYQDSRLFELYLLQAPHSKENLSYEQYKNKVRKKQSNKRYSEIADTKTAKKKNENILLNFLNSQKKNKK